LVFAIKAEEKTVKEVALKFMRRDPPWEANPSYLEPIGQITGPVVVASKKDHDVMVVKSDKHKRTVFAIEVDDRMSLSRAEIAFMEAREFDPRPTMFVSSSRRRSSLTDSKSTPISVSVPSSCVGPYPRPSIACPAIG
jgi:hypothetical protein